MAKKATSRKASGASAPKEPSGLIEEIRRLVQLMVDNDLSELDVQDQDRRIALKRGAIAGTPAMGFVPAAPVVAAEADLAPSVEPAEPADELIDIRSPVVGTFYLAQSPDTEPFVEVGTEVDNETVVCIIEAMKVMNEIKAECAGTIAEVCVKNVQPVEFAQVLFRVRPA